MADFTGSTEAPLLKRRNLPRFPLQERRPYDSPTLAFLVAWASSSPGVSRSRGPEIEALLSFQIGESVE